MMQWTRLALVAVLVTAGCQTNPFARSSGSAPEPGLEDEETVHEGPALPDPGLLISTEQRFPDLPLPVGVKEDAERTFVFESSDLAVGRMVYATKSTVNELAQFYIDECPAADWELDSVIQANGAELLFRKPGKRLAVMIRDLGVARGRMLTLTLTPEVQK